MKPKMTKILNYEYILSLKNQLNYQEMVLEGNINWVTNSQLGQQHKLLHYFGLIENVSINIKL